MQDNSSLHSIRIVAEMLGAHPETQRVWERFGIINPRRKGGKRFYSDIDLKRLRFIKSLIREHLNLPAIQHYLKLYPCWETETYPSCMKVTQQSSCAKPCWREEGAYCQVYGNPELCTECEYTRKQTGETT